jgi:hypothetical protein
VQRSPESGPQAVPRRLRAPGGACYPWVCDHMISVKSQVVSVWIERGTAQVVFVEPRRGEQSPPPPEATPPCDCPRSHSGTRQRHGGGRVRGSCALCRGVHTVLHTRLGRECLPCACPAQEPAPVSLPQKGTAMSPSTLEPLTILAPSETASPSDASCGCGCACGPSLAQLALPQEAVDREKAQPTRS